MILSSFWYHSGILGFLHVKFIADFRMMVMACSGHQFSLCRQFTYRTIIPPTMGQPAIVNTSNSAHSIGSITSNGDMHVDQDAVGKHNMELDNTLPPHQPIIAYADSNADADTDYDNNDGQTEDKAMLLAAGTVQSSSSALYQHATIAHAECL